MIYPNCTGKQVMGRKSNPRTVRVKTRFTRTTNRLGVQTPLSGSPLESHLKPKYFRQAPRPECGEPASLRYAGSKTFFDFG